MPGMRLHVELDGFRWEQGLVLSALPKAKLIFDPLSQEEVTVSERSGGAAAPEQL